MDTKEIYILNAFARTKNGGNPAGVVLNADNLSNETMQKIAKQIGFSETAFVQDSNKADFKVQFFTPNKEVNLCGHATIATFFLLLNKNIIGSGKYTQETKAGVLDLEIKDKKASIFMNQTKPKFLEIIKKDEIANSLNISQNKIMSNLPIQIVTTGLRDIIVPIKSLKDLTQIEPDFNYIQEISEKYNVVGYHLFTLETKFDSIAHCRNFAPLYDISEEAATGTSNGALASYLYHHRVLVNNNLEELTFEQGYSLDRPSEIVVKLNTRNNNISKVMVGGSAIEIDKKEIMF